VPASNQVIIGSANAGTVQEVGGYFQSVDRAGLDLNSVLVLSDSEGVFSTDASPFTDLAPGPLSNRFDLFIDTSRLGKFSGTYQFNLSDEQDLSGWAGGQMLTLNVTADVVPEPSTLVLLVAAAVGLLTFAWHARGAIPRT